MKDQEENKRLSIEQGRELIKNTSLKNLSDDELEKVLKAIQAFCEINFEIYTDLINRNNFNADLVADNEILLHSDQGNTLDKAA